MARLNAIRERAIALGWPNIYTYTKGLAEHSLATRALKKTTVRPSVVECSRAFPFAGWNEGINTSGPLIWFLSGALGSFPCRPKNHFDVVPVDTVSRGVTLALVALLRGEAEEVYQLGSSQVNPSRSGGRWSSQTSATENITEARTPSPWSATSFASWTAPPVSGMTPPCAPSLGFRS